MRFIILALFTQVLLLAALNISAATFDIDYITYKAKNEKTSILVFTDTSCGYCRKLHKEIPDLNASGITVKYLPFPRKGANSKSAKKLASIYCSDDPQRAMTKAKAGFTIAAKTCENPVTQVYDQAKSENVVRGTPAIYSSDSGQILGGYITAEQAASKLNVPYIAASAEDKKAFQAISYEKQSMNPTYYLVEKRMAWRTLPTEEVKGSGSLGRNGIMIATHYAEVDGTTWVGKTQKEQDYYFNGNNLKKVSEVRDFEVTSHPQKQYVTNAPTSIYLVPSTEEISVRELRANTRLEPTFEYQANGVKWLGYEKQDIKYFVLADLLDEMP